VEGCCRLSLDRMEMETRICFDLKFALELAQEGKLEDLYAYVDAFLMQDYSLGSPESNEASSLNILHQILVNQFLNSKEEFDSSVNC